MGTITNRIPHPSAVQASITIDPDDPKAQRKLVRYLAMSSGDLVRRLVAKGGTISFDIADGHEEGKDPSLSKKRITALHIDIRRR